MKKSQRKNVLLAGQDHYNKFAGMEFHQISQILPSNLHVHCFCIVEKRTKHVFFFFLSLSNGIFSHKTHRETMWNSAADLTQKNVLEPLSPNRSKTHLKETKSKEPTHKQFKWRDLHQKELNITYGWLQKPFLALLRVKTPTVLIAGASAATENTRPASDSPRLLPPRALWLSPKLASLHSFASASCIF